MSPAIRSAATLLAGAALAVPLGGCGSATKTVTAASTPAPSQPSTQTTASTPSTAATAPPTSTPTHTQTQTGTNGGTPAPTSTRSAPEPAFTQQESQAEGLSGAVAVLRARGFTAGDSSEYHPDQALRVLIGTRAAGGDGHEQQAFFFVNGRYIGTDSSQPSATLHVVGQSDTEVTLAYSLYRGGDSLCCPSGGQARVRFQLNNGKLTPLDPIPPANSTTGLSRQ